MTKKKMANDSRKEIFLTHLNDDIFKNGLKFERDRTFRNKLIVKAIVVMAVLLIMATVLCVTMSKSSVSTTVNETKLIKLNRKVPYNYDPDSLEFGNKEPEVLKDVKTEFVPATDSYVIGRRIRRDVGDFLAILSTTNGYADEELVWKKVSKVGQKLETQSSKIVDDRRYDQLQQISETKTEEHTDRIRDISMFWNDKRDRQSIRNSQAQKMLSYMDLTADPCEDFFQYACGNWEQKNPIPDDKAGFDTFEMLRESLDSVLRDLLLEPTDDKTPEAFVKAKELFASCMNEEILEKRGNEPLLELSRRLKGWPMIDPDWNSTGFDWVDLMAQLRLYNNDILLSQWVGPDIKSSSNYIVQFDQTSLGLPTREYYLQQTNAAYLEAYQTYMINIAVLLGADVKNATRDAEEIIAFETELARISSSNDERRNVSELYVKMTLKELSDLIPQINWVKYLTLILAREVDVGESVVTFALKYFKDLVKLVERSNPRTVSNYLMWRFMRHRVNNLDKKFQDAKQEFYYALFGREKAPARWNTCVTHVNTNMGMALGSMFVQRYFDETSKNDTVGMTQDIMESFREMLNTTDWIDQETKILAKNKVSAMMLRIGYPDFILDQQELDTRYRDVNVSRDLYFENTLNLLTHLTRVEQDRLGTTVNKTQWNTPPAVVNAYYSRNKNQIMFPAGILQPPFYHKHFPRSLNYGGIGVVIGHEITHGFDDKGRLFDQDGNLHRWWKEEAIERFHQKAQCLIDQYSAYTLREIDMRIDGVNTQGENIADNGGIKQAFSAYERWLSRHNPSDETLPGLNTTNFQLFFLNFAQVWCGAMRPEASKNKLKTAVHSPGRFRVIGTLSNSEEFARVFNCTASSMMNPVNKCSVW